MKHLFKVFHNFNNLRSTLGLTGLFLFCLVSVNSHEARAKEVPSKAHLKNFPKQFLKRPIPTHVKKIEKTPAPARVTPPPPITLSHPSVPLPTTKETPPGVEESVDLSADVASSFNPYLFERQPLWVLLPLFMLILLGLHLLPIPKRKRSKKILTEQFLSELQKSTEAKK